MKYKNIKEEDHRKVFDNIFPIEFNLYSSSIVPRKYKEEFKGCLFIYDENFSLNFEKLIDEKIGYGSGMNLNYFLGKWKQ
jgi:hypothetical protein